MEGYACHSPNNSDRRTFYDTRAFEAITGMLTIENEVDDVDAKREAVGPQAAPPGKLGQLRATVVGRVAEGNQEAVVEALRIRDDAPGENGRTEPEKVKKNCPTKLAANAAASQGTYRRT